MKRRIYIWGWWQGNNLGDNWIKKTLHNCFPQAEFIDSSVQKFEKGSFVICGGGGLFIYDVINPWTNPQKDISYGILGMGAEFPHHSNKAVELAKAAKFFLARDQYSLDCMHLDIPRSYDLTFANPLKRVDKLDDAKKQVFFVWRDGHELLSDEQFSKYIENGSSYDEWKEVIQKNFKIIVEDDFQTREDNIEDRISGSTFVVSGRYHGIVAAIQKGLPFVAIDICPKIRALLKECGLDKYCIKISQIDQLENLIEDACKNIDEIRSKEKEYRDKAYSVLLEQIEDAKLEILKVLNPLNIIHYGSYWMKKNDVVYTMSDDLSELCNLKRIDLRLYGKFPSNRIAENKDTDNGKQCLLDGKRVLRDVKRNSADAVILNSGGLYLDDVTFEKLREQKVYSIGISLSDPDVFPYNGKIYANKFDLFYTNSKYSLMNDYPEIGSNIRLMPFAASIKHHYYMPEVERKYDVIVVAHARADRLPVIEKLERICKVGTYGGGWKNSLGVVNGLEHVKAINSGKMYISFSRTVAGFDNVKVGLFEAMACNQVVITSYMEELQDYFDIGTEIICYKEDDELYDLVKYYLNHESEREQIRQRGYNRFLRDHTYEKRWNSVLKEVYKEKNLL